MNKNKLLIILVAVLLANMFFATEAVAGCSRRQIQRACDSCAQQTLNSSQCMGSSSTSCPVCPTSTSTQNCIEAVTTVNDTWKSLLSRRYSLTLSVVGGGTSIYQFNPSVASVKSFTYTLFDNTTGTSFNSGIGYADILTLNFLVPVVIGSTVHPMHCTAPFESFSSSRLSGTCQGIQIGVVGNSLTRFSATLSAVPN